MPTCLCLALASLCMSLHWSVFKLCREQRRFLGTKQRQTLGAISDVYSKATSLLQHKLVQLADMCKYDGAGPTRVVWPRCMI